LLDRYLFAASRIEQAKGRLTSDACIKAVAREVGFNSPSNFTAAFRRATGETPSAYQQRARRHPAPKPRRPN
jgi:AraC family transcriptional regulator